MRIFKFSAVAAVVAVVAAVAVAPAPASKSVSFSGSYKGKASVVKKGSAITITSVKGSGSGTLGLNKLAGSNGKGTASSSCASFGGPATISGKSGSIKLSVVKTKSNGCGTGDDIAVKGVASVAGGSGKFGKAKGSLSFKGSFNKKSGSFSVKITGKLSV